MWGSQQCPDLSQEEVSWANMDVTAITYCKLGVLLIACAPKSNTCTSCTLATAGLVWNIRLSIWGLVVPRSIHTCFIYWNFVPKKAPAVSIALTGQPVWDPTYCWLCELKHSDQATENQRNRTRMQRRDTLWFDANRAHKTPLNTQLTAQPFLGPSTCG